MSLSQHLKSKGVTFSQKEHSPIWAGPESDKDNGGITFSLLNKYLQCHERFRLLVVEGLKTRDEFNHRLGYGNMWHTCEEAHAAKLGWELPLKAYCASLCRQYPTAQSQVNHWYNVCKVQFPLYVKYWSEHPDMKGLTPLLQEEKFKVPYTLPSGRTVYLRGKWDSVDVVNNQIWLMENKTKGDVRPELLRKQLTFDLQTMLYLVALRTEQQRCTTYEPNGIWTTRSGQLSIHGIRYNVVRRPLSGGKGNIKPHKARGKTPAETMESFYNRLAKYIEDDPGHYFIRFNVKVTPEDIDQFKKQCFNPILEQLCQWWEQVSVVRNRRNPFEDSLEGDDRGFPNSLHFRMPFGLRQLEENMSTELDEYMSSGITVGLQRTIELFPELA